jgi:phospholipid/cholesterol/gamma-HCH transport system permease protein
LGVKGVEDKDPSTMRGSVALRLEPGGRAVLALRGHFLLDGGVPSHEEVARDLKDLKGISSVGFDCGELGKWDSSLLAFVLRLEGELGGSGIVVERSGLPKGAKRLLDLAASSPRGQARERERGSLFLRTGQWASSQMIKSWDVVGFLGEVSWSMGRLVTGRARFRGSDLLHVMHRCGVDALPIVSLISFLVGLILAFVGAVQLRVFGAQIFVAALVGIGMVRVLGAIMTGIIMAGRTGAAFAAELGTMELNEEIDALRTLGIPPVEFLVLPRMVGLSLMMPLLCVYSDLLGILGGLSVGVVMLDINIQEYLRMTREAVRPSYFWIGIFHSFVFGVLVAITGCFHGMRAGRSASSVGQAATSAVVSGIVSIIVATAVITYLCQVLGL